MFHMASVRNKVIILLLLGLAACLVFACASCADGDDDDNNNDNNNGTPADDDTPDPEAFTLTSTAFDDLGDIPLKHACTNQDGQNISPPLAWNNAPAETVALALTFIDLDGPEDLVAHWGLINIPNDVSSLVEGITATNAPAGAWQTLNYRGQIQYDGPCPPSRHRYEFTLYALDTGIEDPGTGTDLFSLTDEIDQKTIATTKLLGQFPPE